MKLFDNPRARQLFEKKLRRPGLQAKGVDMARSQQYLAKMAGQTGGNSGQRSTTGMGTRLTPEQRLAQGLRTSIGNRSQEQGQGANRPAMSQTMARLFRNKSGGG